jgi:flagellar protein FlbD
MITVTKLNDREVVVNCNLIEVIEATPDTTITMTTGRKLIVRESVDEIVERVIDYNHRAVKPQVRD